MKYQQKVKATPEELKSFDWLPISKWSVETIINRHDSLDGGRICKLCDKNVSASDLVDHVKKHVAARKLLAKKEREEALRRAREARKLKKEEKNGNIHSSR